MRIIKTLADAQLIINDILDWKEKLTTKSWDFHGLRITNASPSVDPNDYVIQSELSDNAKNGKTGKDVYTAVFCSPVPLDGDVLPYYIAGEDRDGKLTQVWLAAVTGPTTGNLSIDPKINGVSILTSPIVMPSGSSATVTSSAFVTPIPSVGLLTKINGLINTAGDALGISMGVVVRRA